MLTRLFPSTRRREQQQQQQFWSQPFEQGSTVEVRVVLFRDCERKGKKLLYDSQTVEVEEVVGEPESGQYTEVVEGRGYRYLHPPARDARQLSEMIFGSAAVAYQAPNMKLHPLEGGGLLWSSVLQAPRLTRPAPASDQELHINIVLPSKCCGCSLCFTVNN